MKINSISRLSHFKSGSYLIYHQVQHPKIPHSAYRLYLRFLYGSENKQHLLSFKALTHWFLQPRWRVLTARYKLNLQTKQITLRP